MNARVKSSVTRTVSLSSPRISLFRNIYWRGLRHCFILFEPQLLFDKLSWSVCNCINYRLKFVSCFRIILKQLTVDNLTLTYLSQLYSLEIKISVVMYYCPLDGMLVHWFTQASCTAILAGLPASRGIRITTPLGMQSPGTVHATWPFKWPAGVTMNMR